MWPPYVNEGGNPLFVLYKDFLHQNCAMIWHFYIEGLLELSVSSAILKCSHAMHRPSQMELHHQQLHPSAGTHERFGPKTISK